MGAFRRVYLDPGFARRAADFYKSDDAERHSNGFNLSTSADGTTFTDVADGLASIIPTPLGEGNTYDLSASTSAVKVRMTGTDSDQEWLSVCEVRE